MDSGWEELGLDRPWPGQSPIWSESWALWEARCLFGAAGLNRRKFSKRKRKKKKVALSSCLENSLQHPPLPSATLHQLAMISHPKPKGRCAPHPMPGSRLSSQGTVHTWPHWPVTACPVPTVSPSAQAWPAAPGENALDPTAHLIPLSSHTSYPDLVQGPAGQTGSQRRRRCPAEEGCRAQGVSNPQKDLTQCRAELSWKGAESF